MNSNANKTRTILLMMCHNEVVSYLKSSNAIKINSRTPFQQLQLFETYEIQINNPIITGIGSKDNTNRNIRRGISNNFSDIIKEFVEENSHSKDEIDTYIKELQTRKILFSKHKLQSQVSCESSHMNETRRSMYDMNHNKELMNDIKMNCMLMKKDQLHLIMKKAMVCLKKIANDIKRTNYKKSDKKEKNHMKAKLFESPEPQKSTSSFTSNESSTSLKKKNNPHTPKYINKNNSISPIRISSQNTHNKKIHKTPKANLSSDISQIQRPFNKKNTFNSNCKCNSEFKIDLIQTSMDIYDNNKHENTIYDTKLINGSGSGPISVFRKNEEGFNGQLFHYSPEKKMNVFRENSDLYKKKFKKSKTNLTKILKHEKKSKLMDQLIALYPSKTNDSSASD